VIPYGRQSIDDDDIDAVVRVLRSDWLTQGPYVEEFEAELCRATGATFAIAFANGTAALHAACAAARLASDDHVVTSPLSFVASANCARYVGASVGFVDIDPDTLNLDVSRMPRCDALIAVHYAGLPVRLDQLPHRPRIVIEDAAHAIGAVTPDGPVGNCAYSDMTCFSFHPVKTVTTAEGGAVTTNAPELAERLRRFRSHGMVAKPAARGEGGWYYEVEDVGFNYRLTDVQAALGTSQLGKLARFIERRNQLASRYRAQLGDLHADGMLELAPEAPAGTVHGRHLYPIRVGSRRAVYDALRDADVRAQVHYVPIHLHPTFAAAGFGRGDFPEAERAYSRLLSLPLYASLSDDEQDHVIGVLRDALTARLAA